MHYAISHHNNEFPYLVIQPRKRSLKHVLLRVNQGLALLKLGKIEYAIEDGQTVWLPFDALVGVTFFPNTCAQRVEVSCRVTEPLPKQGGYVELTPLGSAIVDRLGEEQQSQQAEKKLLSVLLDELVNMEPELSQSALTVNIQKWSPSKNDNTLSAEQHITLTLREATKRIQSGVKKSQVINDLFEGNEQVYEQLEQTILRHSKE